MGEEINAYRVWLERTDGKRPLRKLENNIRMNLKETE